MVAALNDSCAGDAKGGVHVRLISFHSRELPFLWYQPSDSDT